jgi:integrase
MASNNSRFHKTYERAEKYSENIIKDALRENRITKDDEQLIREYVGEISSETTISPIRKMKLYYILTSWRRYIGPYQENTITDLYNGIQKLETATKLKKTSKGWYDTNERLKRNTIVDYKHFIKRFYRWLIDNEYSKIDYKKIDKIRAGGYNNMTKTVGDLLDEEEIKKLIQACDNTRDKAFIALLWEGAFRVGELGNLQWNKVKINDWNIAINVDDKTGIPRYVPLIFARPYFLDWQNDYPLPIKDDGYVFITKYNEQLQYNGVRKRINVLIKRAGLDKKITPHIFRHSRITFLIKQGMSGEQIKMMCWGTVNTDQFKTYLHLANVDLDNEIKKLYGVKTIKDEDKKIKSILEPVQCKRCLEINTPSSNYCRKCGRPITDDAEVSQRAAEEYLRSLPEYHAVLDRIKDDMIKK